MRCAPCNCTHTTYPGVDAQYAAYDRTRTGLVVKRRCSYLRRRNVRNDLQPDSSSRRRVLSYQVAAQATQQAQEWTSDILAELKQEGNGSTEQYQLPLLPVVLIDEVLNCSAEQLSRIICQPDPHFQATIHKLAGNNDLQQGNWHQQDGRLIREEQYVKSLKQNSIGPTEAFCIDQQQCIRRSTAGFAVERKVFTPKVPFGGSFHNLVQWCAWDEPGSGKAHLQVSCDVVFTNKWVPAKSLITNSSIEGMMEYYKMWLHELNQHLNLPSSDSQSEGTLLPPGQPQSSL
ncbi:hypothetical protein ABBQ32_002846 [Trebouxia sp. C0010 RCD-2024]